MASGPDDLGFDRQVADFLVQAARRVLGRKELVKGAVAVAQSFGDRMPAVEDDAFILARAMPAGIAAAARRRRSVEAGLRGPSSVRS